jgi:hypothetical protein
MILPIPIPNDFYKAWVHCLLAFMYLAQTNESAAQKHLMKCEKYLSSGRNEIMALLSCEILTSRELVPVFIIFEKLLLQNMQKLPDGVRHIDQIYREYLRMVVRALFCSLNGYTSRRIIATSKGLFHS